MSSPVEVGSWLANPEDTLEKLAELAVARRTVRALSKKADLLGDAQRLLSSGVDAVRPHAQRAMAAAQPHVDKAVDWAQKNPELALTLGGGATGAALSAGGNLTSRKRRRGSLLGDVVTGGLAGTAVGGGLAALHYANKMNKSEPAAPAPPPEPQVPLKAGVDPVQAKAKLDALSAPTPGKVVHDTVEGLGGVARRNWLMTTLLGGDIAGTVRGMSQRAGSHPQISSHVSDLDRVLAQIERGKYDKGLLSHLGGGDGDGATGKKILNALKGLDSPEKRQQFLLEGIRNSTSGTPLNIPGSSESLSPHQLGKITAHGSPLTAHAPDGLLHKALGITLPGSGPRRLLDRLRGRTPAAPSDRLARMGYEVNNGPAGWPTGMGATGAIREAPGRLNSLRRWLSNRPRWQRGLPLRAGLYALPTLGLEGARMYNEGAKQKAELAKHIADVMGE